MEVSRSRYRWGNGTVNRNKEFYIRLRQGLTGPTLFAIIEKSEALNQLVAVIHNAIRARGFYLFMDDRLKHICGDDYTEDTSLHRDLIAKFAEKHHLCWRMTNGL